MLKYMGRRLRVYLDTSVVSYFAADLSADSRIAAWQAESRRFWNEYQDRFEFVISDTVIAEARRGNVAKARRRLTVLAPFPRLPMTEAARALAQNLLDERAVPENLRTDAEHIAIATVHGVEYLVSWNHKHLVNENQLRQIRSVCETSGFRLPTVCTPTILMEETAMKETRQKYPIPDFDPGTYTDPILEEYYEMKREFNAEFNSLDELHDYLVAQEIEERKKGQTYLPVPPNLARYPHQEDDSSC